MAKLALQVHGKVSRREWLRFLRKMAVTNDEHWVWQACRGYNGYGQFGWRSATYRAHRFAYMALRGDIPVGRELDHLCSIRSCVNPGCLEIVTRKMNQQRSNSISGANSRKTHCQAGHSYAENGYRASRRLTNGRLKQWRGCRRCRAQHNADYQAKHPTRIHSKD